MTPATQALADGHLLAGGKAGKQPRLKADKLLRPWRQRQPQKLKEA